ncbi:DUF1842 domain-containing protein [bacterium SCSIO 12741]|nr:DUF1842 domain-containing protein [bacterium SCSIO 12741]
MSNNENGQGSSVGLFLVNYRVGNGMPGGVQLNLSLLVNTPDQKVTGVGHLGQSTNPPLSEYSQIKGDYSYMCTMNSCNILVVATGEGPSPILVHGVPMMVTNLKLRMSLEEDWQSGTAVFEYLRNGKWEKVGPVPVNVAEDQVGNSAQLADAVKNANSEAVS